MRKALTVRTGSGGLLTPPMNQVAAFRQWDFVPRPPPSLLTGRAPQSWMFSLPGVGRPEVPVDPCWARITAETVCCNAIHLRLAKQKTDGHPAHFPIKSSWQFLKCPGSPGLTLSSPTCPAVSSSTPCRTGSVADTLGEALRPWGPHPFPGLPTPITALSHSACHSATTCLPVCLLAGLGSLQAQAASLASQSFTCSPAPG